MARRRGAQRSHARGGRAAQINKVKRVCVVFPLRLPSTRRRDYHARHLLHSLRPCQESSYSCSHCMLLLECVSGCALCPLDAVRNGVGGARRSASAFLHTRLCGEPSENRAHSRVGLSFQTKPASFFFFVVGNKASLLSVHGVRSRHTFQRKFYVIHNFFFLKKDTDCL